MTVRVSFDIEKSRLRVIGLLDGVDACISYAIGLLLERRRGLIGRLGRCGYSKCQRFHFHHGEAGRPRSYCNITHRRKAEAEQRKEQRRKDREKRLRELEAAERAG